MKSKKRGFALQLWWWCSFAAFIMCALLTVYYIIQSANHKRDMDEMTAYVMGSGTAAPTLTPTLPQTAFSSSTPAREQAAEPAPVPATAQEALPSLAPLREQAAAPALAPTATSAPKPLSAEDEALLQRYRALAAENPDLIGWLCVNGTRINDPVMYTPNDSQHYLNRDFKGAYSTAGQLFMDASCDTDDVPGNKIIYGHNMRDGTRFADLKRYLDEEFFSEQPIIQFDTLHGRGQYQVMAAFVMQVQELDAPSMLCYRSIDTTDEATLAQLSQYLDQNAKVRAQGVSPQWGDELLTLSTCGRTGSNERVIVMARRVREEEK